MEITGMIVADKAQRRFLAEALPNAPVVDDGRSPEALAQRRRQRLRQSTARTLRRAADRLETKPRWAIN
jgi:hypothetical protein